MGDLYGTIAAQCGNVNGASWEDARDMRALMCRMIRDQYATKRARGIDAGVCVGTAQDDVRKIIDMAYDCACNDAVSQLSEIAFDGILP